VALDFISFVGGGNGGGYDWCAAQIGVADEILRERCIRFGKWLKLYKDYPVSKGCTCPFWIETLVVRV
jgi:hypothetical protein